MYELDWQLRTYFVLENCDKYWMHLHFNFDAFPVHSPFRFSALDASKSQRACIILSQFTRSEYAIINL